METKNLVIFFFTKSLLEEIYSLIHQKKEEEIYYFAEQIYLLNWGIAFIYEKYYIPHKHPTKLTCQGLVAIGSAIIKKK